MPRVEVFTSIKEAEPLWRAAEAQGIGYGFESFAWLSTWQETIGASEGTRPYIICVFDVAGAPVMLLPLGIRRYFGCAVLSFLGGKLADYHAPIFRADFARQLDAAEFESLWADILRQLPSIDVISLSRLAQHVDGFENPFTRLAGARRTANSYFAVLDKSFADFQRSQSGDLRRDSRRKHRRLAEIGAVSFRIADNAAEISACVEALVQQRMKQRREPSYSRIFQAPAYRTFYKRMALEHCHTGLIHVSALCLNDKIVATHWGMVHRNRFYWLVPAYEDGPWAKYSPGRLLLEHLVEWCFANRIRVLDLTIGDEAYKRQWTDRTMALVDVEQARSFKGAWLVITRRVLFGVKQWIKQHPRMRALLGRAWVSAGFTGDMRRMVQLLLGWK